jgi:hypothetical protein
LPEPPLKPVLLQNGREETGEIKIGRFRFGVSGRTEINNIWLQKPLTADDPHKFLLCRYR